MEQMFGIDHQGLVQDLLESAFGIHRDFLKV